MAAFVFIHSAGDVGWYWDLVAAGLRERGHGTTALDLPCEDDSAGLAEYADTVVPAASDRTGYWPDRRYEEEVRERYDGDIALFHEDVPPELAAEALRGAHPRAEPPTQTGGPLYGICRRAGADFCRAPTWPRLTAGCWP
jgi:hypothetical protein